MAITFTKQGLQPNLCDLNTYLARLFINNLKNPVSLNAKPNKKTGLFSVKTRFLASIKPFNYPKLTATEDAFTEHFHRHVHHF